MEPVGTHCRFCPLTCRVTKRMYGCVIIINTVCEAGHVFTWTSSPSMINSNNAMMYQCNMAFVSTLLLSGNNFYKICQFCRFLDMKCISPSTCFAYQRLCLCSVIQKFFDHKMVSNVNLFLVFGKINT